MSGKADELYKPQPACAVVAEYLRELTVLSTYLPHKNIEFVFGFLWGIPVPIVMFAVHLHAANLPFSVETCWQVLMQNPLYIILVLHPVLFAIVFGAHGTMRANRDRQIHDLVADLECRCDELCQANARLSELDRLKSEFLANVTHELKSPLVTALGYSDRMLGEHLGPVTERQRKALEVSKRNLIRLRALIDEILDFSRLEAGIVSFKKVQTNLNEVVGVAIENLTLKAREHNIQISADVPPEPTTVMGDHGKLTQVIVNLLDNAIKFSPDGAKIHVDVKPRDDLWHMQVIDHGKGIAADVVPKLFQRFYQADGSLSRPHNGVGLGLVVVKRIVEQHGGRIWIESQPGVGTTFHIEIPKAESRELPDEIPEMKEVSRAAHTAD